ncbi:MAG: uroporphyrinogen-III C-methyltransferase [Pseudomonadales bacterium]
MLGALALLIALAAAGVAGYLYYELFYRGAAQELTQRVTALENASSSDERQLVQLESSLEQSLGDLRQTLADQQQAREASEAALRDALAEATRRAPPTSREWRVAEVQYLLRIANNRLTLEHDVPGALGLLRAADAILVELDDFALFQVRAALADEILALEKVRGTDVQGLFLRLEALKGDLERLPLRLPEYLAGSQSTGAATADGATLWQRITEQLSSYLQLRRFDGAVKPLLAPEEAVYLELNLRLMLERAQLAALRREQLIYVQSLETARDWIERFLDTDQQPVQVMRRELDALIPIALDQPLPDISASLRALTDVVRTPS